MKIKLLAVTILLFASLTSCGSDKLTKQKAESMIKECQTKENFPKTRTFFYGLVERWDIFKKKFPNFLETHRKLEKLGLFDIGELQRIKGDMGTKDSYLVTLTSKGKEYLTKSTKGNKGKVTGKFKICEYKFGSIVEINQSPEKKLAQVKFKIIRFNETPFFEESHNRLNPKEKFKTIIFSKIDGKWQLCDKTQRK